MGQGELGAFLSLSRGFCGGGSFVVAMERRRGVYRPRYGLGWSTPLEVG
jgi:hypothetical protein